jgi:hypothetical protein
MAKGQHWQNAIFIFLALHLQKGMNVSFLVPLESLHFDL